MNSGFDRSYYETYYRDYERQNPPSKLAFYRMLARRAAGGVQLPRILDIGCAFGNFLGSLDPSWERCGVDASGYAISLASGKFPEVAFKAAAPGEHPFAGPFHVITAFDVLEHIPDLTETLGWINANLAQGGGLVLVVPVYDGPTGPVIRFLDKDPTHIHRKGRDFWLGLECPGLRLLDWSGIYRYLIPGGYYLHFAARRWRRFTPAIACIFRRKGL
jgi:SAM-dependent methyltransferase